MKKFVLIFLIVIMFSGLSMAQRGITWIGAGIKAGYGTSFLFNSSSFSDPSVNYSFFTPSYTYGAKLAFSFNEGAFGFQLEYNNAVWGQKFTVDDGKNVTDHSASLKSMGFGLIFKTVSLGGFYFELGPQYNIITAASFDGSSIRSNLIEKYPSGVVGMGFMPLFGKRMELSLGVRSIVSLGSINAVENFSIYSSSPNYSNYTNNNVISVMFVPMIDFTYVFAYMGRASCGHFRIMINK